MEIIQSLQKYPLTGPCILTIGNFDGVHRGHKALLSRLTEAEIPGVAITFKNHPSTILRPELPVKYICTVEHRIKLLEESGLDTLALLRFTPAFSKQTAESFLRETRQFIPFTRLILGHDATLGKDRHGNPELIRKLGSDLGFEVEYIQEVVHHGITVSSSKIRQLINKGALKEAEDLLGRRYSIYGQIHKGKNLGSQIGFRTANMSVDDLCLPPFGVYAVNVSIDGKNYKGIANLGVAPTVHEQRKASFEVHIFEFEEDLYGQWIELTPTRFIRPEKKFQNLQELQEQIAKDIRAVKN